MTIVTIMSFLTKSDCLSIDDARPSPLASQSRQHVMSAAKLRLFDEIVPFSFFSEDIRDQH